jgi:hypothetical protein
LNFSVVGGVEHSLTLITQTVEESVFNLLIHWFISLTFVLEFEPRVSYMLVIFSDATQLGLPFKFLIYRLHLTGKI